MKILIIKLAATGDVLRTTSILAGLKEQYTDVEIWWVTKEYPSQLLKNNRLIDNICTIENKEEIEELKKQEFDITINLDEEEESCELASQIKTKKMIGAYSEGGKRIYTEDSAPWFDMGLISKYGKEKADQLKKQNKETYQHIICNILKIKNSRPTINLDKEELNFAENFAKKNNIKQDDLVIGLNTSAGKRWQLKKLPLEKTIELAEKIYNEFKAKILLFGGPEEKERNEKIKQALNGKIIDTGCNNSLSEFASLINLCSILITSDSLALNIGVTLKKNVIAFFGPTSAAEIDLYSHGKKIAPKMDCICCYKKECNLKPSCMDKIEIGSFINAIELLEKK